AVIPKEPHGHELHLYRQDSDYFLMQTAVKYGATIYQNRKVVDVDFDADFPVVRLEKGDPVSAKYIVDASGFRSPLAQKFGLRHREIETRSRGIFTHMIDVSAFEHLSGVDPKNLPFPMAEGTLHHVFEGGWLWVIPFNNHPQATNSVCSVGLLLDPERFPEDRSLSPEEEFFKFIQRFPEIARQLKTGKAIRPWVRAPRIQYGAAQVVGNRWALLGHAAGFVDPLFSKGLYASLSGVSMLAYLLLKADAIDDYRRAAFLPFERLTLNYLKNNDRLISNAYRSFQHPELWRRYAVLWLLGAYTEYLQLNMIRAKADGNRDTYYADFVDCCLVGGGFDEFSSLSSRVDQLLTEFTRKRAAGKPVSIENTVSKIDQLYAEIYWMPKPFVDILNGAASLPRRKVRTDLFKQEAGFLGAGRYRQHFFGSQSLLGLVKLYLTEKWRYGRIRLILEPHA
ncbi:MAG: tryptophan 7-halogenase, partial [Chloroflexota bacterium]